MFLQQALRAASLRQIPDIDHIDKQVFQNMAIPGQFTPFLIIICYNAALIAQPPRGGIAFFVEHTAYSFKADPFSSEFKDLDYDWSDLMINYQSAPIIFILQIAIWSIIANVITAQPLILHGRTDLFGYVLCVHIVDQIFKSGGELFTGISGAAVIIVADGNKAYAEERKDAFQIFSGLYIVSAKARKVLHNDAVDSPFPHIFDHSMKCGTLKS